MGKISRRGLFGLGAGIAALPTVAKAQLSAYAAAFAREAVKIGDGLRVRLPTNYAPLKVGDRITMNGKPWGHVTAVSDDV